VGAKNDHRRAQGQKEGLGSGFRLEKKVTCFDVRQGGTIWGPRNKGRGRDVKGQSLGRVHSAGVIYPKKVAWGHAQRGVGIGDDI